MIRNGPLERKLRHGAGLAELVVSSRFPFGRDVLTYDWDLLVILDTCRVDALQSVCGDYGWSAGSDIETVLSIGGSTLEWTAQTFREKHRDTIREISYVSGNLNVDHVLSGERSPEGHIGPEWIPTNWTTVSKDCFDEFIPVWKFDSVSEFDSLPEPYPSAERMTDHAIQLGRSRSPTRCIVHYMEPHMPYISAARTAGRSELLEHERNPFEYLKNGGNRDKVWEAYLTTLRKGMEEVGSLLRNFNADRVVVTADHGEAFGEWWGYGHRSGSINPYVRRVPWIETTATDQHTREPNIKTTLSADRDVEKILDALGYL